MFEQDWFRLNAQYLIPTSTDYSLTGPLFDMRMHLKGRFYVRERVGIYAYRNPNEASPSHHVSAVSGLRHPLRVPLSDAPVARTPRPESRQRLGSRYGASLPGTVKDPSHM